MRIKKCPACGAQIEYVRVGVIECEYCGSHIENTGSEWKVQEGEYSPSQNTTTPNCSKEKTTSVIDRPRASVGTMILLCILCIFPGVIYYNSITKKQKEWDEQYATFNIQRPLRPQIDAGLMTLLCILYVFPGVLYHNSIKKKQEEWDQNHLNVSIE